MLAPGRINLAIELTFMSPDCLCELISHLMQQELSEETLLLYMWPLMPGAVPACQGARP